MVELFKLLNTTPVLELVGASLINLLPTLKTRYDGESHTKQFKWRKVGIDRQVFIGLLRYTENINMKSFHVTLEHIGAKKWQCHRNISLTK